MRRNKTGGLINFLVNTGLVRSEDTTNYEDDRTDTDLPLRSKPFVKRHIASIVRSGWTPSFRPSRGNRFSRAGRARSHIVGS